MVSWKIGIKNSYQEMDKKISVVGDTILNQKMDEKNCSRKSFWLKMGFKKKLEWIKKF